MGWIYGSIQRARDEGPMVSASLNAEASLHECFMIEGLNQLSSKFVSKITF